MDDEGIVVVVDDDQAARESISSFVRSQGVKVAAYESAEAFLEQFDRSKSGCLVTDVRMTGMSGIELLKRLKDENISLQVVVITGFANVPMAVAAMRAGAVTFLEKPCTNESLWQSISLAMERETSRQQREKISQLIEERIKTLTDSEKSVMGMLIEGFPNKQIATQQDLGLRTIELRRAKILQKMKADSLAHLVRMAMTVKFVAPANNA